MIRSILRNSAPLVAALLLWLAAPLPLWASDLIVREVILEPCPVDDIGRQPDRRNPSGASCYALRGMVTNPGTRTVRDTDVYARITDASGEPVLPNRTRVGTIGDVPPGTSGFALRLAIPAGTPGPFTAGSVRARGFASPVRPRGSADGERLPLEEDLAA